MNILQEALSLLLEMIVRYSRLIKSVNISGNKCGNKIADLIKIIILNCTLEKLYMSNMDVTTRLFNPICQSMSKTNMINTIDFSNNTIGIIHS